MAIFKKLIDTLTTIDGLCIPYSEIKNTFKSLDKCINDIIPSSDQDFLDIKFNFVFNDGDYYLIIISEDDTFSISSKLSEENENDIEKLISILQNYYSLA